MSKDEKTIIEEGLSTFAKLLNEIRDSTIDIMKIHPINSLLMLNLISNLGYALFESEENLTFGTTPALEFKSRRRLVAHIFRQNALHSGELLDADKAQKIFSSFNFSKLLGALK